jgi:hypothetical protein
MQPDCWIISLHFHRKVDADNFAAGNCTILGCQFCCHQKKNHIKTKLAVGTTEFHCPQVVFFIFQKNINRENLASFPQKLANYVTLMSVSSLYNPQNSEMKICENMMLTC